MSLLTVEVLGAKLDVYYDCTAERDPYGTGDSPTAYDIDIVSIESGADTQDIQELLANSVIQIILDEIIEHEAA